MMRTVPSLLLLFLLPSCGGSNPERLHDQVRDVGVDEMARIRPASTPEDRFGFRRAPAPPAGEADLVFDLPEGWVRGTANGEWGRILDFKIEGEPDVLCYLSVTQGTGSTLSSNVNRWAGQFQKPPLSEAALDALPERKLLGFSGYYVTFDGAFEDGMNQVSLPDGTLLGIVAPGNAGCLTLKMVGPRDVVRPREAEFLALADSLSLPDEHAAPSRGGAPGAPGAGGALFQNGQRVLEADPPADWRAEERAMRLLSYKIGEGSECSVSAFNGGIGENVNRWRQQMGQPPLDAASIGALPRVELVGAQAAVAVIEGDFTDSMNGVQIPDAMMLGVVCPLPAETLFVKMWGPATEVAARRAEFDAFVKSLREKAK